VGRNAFGLTGGTHGEFRFDRITISVENPVARQSTDDEEMNARHAAATAKVRMWGDRADKARKEGRKADADRCDDKVRDWVSRARQLERTQKRVTADTSDQLREPSSI
jgi:hypothetical protein